MNFELDAPYLEIQRQARDFARAIDPVAVEADEMSEIHPVVLAALRESGLSDLMVPAEYGGRTERLDPLAICVVREVLMATSAHADSMFALQGIGSMPSRWRVLRSNASSGCLKSPWQKPCLRWP